jgi:hypothetical protein
VAAGHAIVKPTAERSLGPIGRLLLEPDVDRHLDPSPGGPMTRRSRVTAWASWLLLLAAALGLAWLALAYDRLAGAADSSGFAAFAIPLAAMAVLTGSVGLLIRLRRPENRIGMLMMLGPLLMLSGFAGYAVGAYRAEGVGMADLLGGLAGAWGGAMVLPGIFMTFPAVVILFPDGHLPSRRWRLVMTPVLAALIGGSLLALVTPAAWGILPTNPLAIPRLSAEVNDIATGVSTLALVASVLLAVVAVAVRFRRATGVERQQLKWLVASVALAGILFPLSFLTEIGPAGLIDVASVAAVALVPGAIGVAILRYRLYEIDRLVSRTLAWALVTGILVAVFAGLVVGLQAVLAPVTDENTLAVAASTLVAFALFQPLRRRVQRAVDRRFDRARYDGERTAAAFGERLRDEVDLAGLETELTHTVALALRPGSTVVWIRNVRLATAAEVP